MHVVVWSNYLKNKPLIQTKTNITDGDRSKTKVHSKLAIIAYYISLLVFQLIEKKFKSVDKDNVIDNKKAKWIANLKKSNKDKYLNKTNVYLNQLLLCESVSGGEYILKS